MKTRKILAASTAALLAFGSVAVVASAADAGEDDATHFSGVTFAFQTSKGASDITDDTLDWDSLKSIVKITATASKSGADDATVELDGTTAGEADSKAYNITVSNTSGKVTVTVDYKKAAADTKFTGSASKSYDINYTAGDVVSLQESGGDTLHLGAGVTASVDKKNVAKIFKDYSISATELDVASSGDYVDVDKSDEIKGLKDELKDQFEEFKAENVATYNIQLSSGKVVKSEAPGKVTIKITTSFEPDYVYHVVGNEVEIIKGAKSEKLTAGGYETTFTTTKFSPFILVKGDKLTGVGVSDEDRDPDAVNATSSAAASNTSATTSNGGTTTNPDTGIALAIAPVVLAAGAVAV
ncbi:MAG: hypothetical protein K2J77_00165, partial [Oscillospiraceae bacterium]|nr:hypothetical protein [Oscillospiraceae bacterium]